MRKQIFLLAFICRIFWLLASGNIFKNNSARCLKHIGYLLLFSVLSEKNIVYSFVFWVTVRRKLF
jgi:hypothetical protein